MRAFARTGSPTVEPLPNNPLDHRAVDPLYSVETAAAATGLKQRTWREIFNRRDVPLVRVLGKLYVRQSDMLAYLEANTASRSER